MKKKKQPGENISLKTKKLEDPLVMDWINSQSNLMDSIRYLIECEINQHGVRNLQAFIPMERKILGTMHHEQVADAALSSKEPLNITGGMTQVAAAAQEEMKQPSEQIKPARSSSTAEEHEQQVEELAKDDDIDDDDIDAWI